MANKKISQLPLGSLTPYTIFPIVSNGITSQIYFNEMLSQIGANSSFITGTGITNTIPKFGSETGLTSSNISDDGLLVTIATDTNINGSLFATTFNKSGGTSSEFLMADGSISTLSSTNTITGTGTTNTLPKFNSINGISDSQIFDNGVSVGIGTFTGSSKLDVEGTIRSTSQTNPTSGLGLELRWETFSNGFGSILAYDRDTPQYKPLQMKASELWFDTVNVRRATITSGGTFLINTTTDNGLDKLQVNGSVNIVSDANINGLTVGKGGGNITTNTIVGFSAGLFNTVGASNTFIGYRTGSGNTTGDRNTFVGRSAGEANTIGVQNVIIGYSAGSSNSGTTSNTIVGYQAGRTSIGNNNSFYGYQAGIGIIGDNNIMFGYDAGRYLGNGITFNSTTNQSTFIGTNTKAFATGDTNEIVIGYNTTGLGSNSVVLGNDSITKTALKGSVLVGTTVDNGVDILQVNGSVNIVSDANINGLTVGKGSGNIGTNTTVGFSAGSLNTTGGSNAFFGYRSGRDNNIGNFNTFIGRSSGELNTIGSSNVSLGYFAGNGNLLGSNNTTIGANAARTSTGTNNTMLGFNAGRYLNNGTTDNTSPSQSLYLGSTTKAFGTGDTNENVIGYDANGLGSNSVVLGNDSVTKTALKGNILIGTTGDTGHKLQVSGTSNFTSDAIINGLTVGKGGGNIDTNTAFGISALSGNTSSGSNVAIGHSALKLNNGSNNIAIGTNALTNATSVLSSVAVGFGALFSADTNGNNTALGYQALYSLTTTGVNNIGIGVQAGRLLNDGITQNSGSVQSIFIGNATRTLATNQTNEIVIGHNGRGLGSNSVVLGNDSITKTALKGNVLIGTTVDNGVDKLQVNGSISSTTFKKSGGTSNQILMADGSVTSNLVNGIEITGTSYTLTNSDHNKQLQTTNSGPTLVIVPSGLTNGFSCSIIQEGTGQVSVSGSTGTTLRYSSFELPTTFEQYSMIGIQSITNLTDNYKLLGQLTSI